MKNIGFVLAVLGSLLFGLSACVPPAEELAAEGEAVVMETAVPDTTEEADTTACEAENGLVFQSEEGGYCFVYPADYCWLPGPSGLDDTFVSVAPPAAESNRCPDEPLILHGDVIWVQVAVSSANGQSLADVRDELSEAVEIFELDIEEITLAGETAVQINNMPGQDISRQITAVHNDQRYQITFVPAEADALYAQVIDSFRFLP